MTIEMASAAKTMAPPLKKGFPFSSSLVSDIIIKLHHNLLPLLLCPAVLHTSVAHLLSAGYESATKQHTALSYLHLHEKQLGNFDFTSSVLLNTMGRILKQCLQ